MATLGWAVSALAGPAAQALDLNEVWLATREHAPQMAVSQAERAAAEARRDQGHALWRPQIGLSLGAGLAGAQTRVDGAHFSAPGLGGADGVGFSTSIHSGAAAQWGLNARQPLYNPERRAQQQQLALGADIAQLQAQAQRQDLMLLSAQRYLEAMLAERRLGLLTRQQQAAQRTLTEAKDRFALGDKPVTDTYEAAARAQALRAQVLQAQTERRLAEARLADLMGVPLAPATVWLAPGEPIRQALAALGELGPWEALALAQHPQLRMQQLAVDLAQQEVLKHQAQAGASLDLVAQVGGERLSGQGSYGNASNSAAQYRVGVQLQWPLSTGGYRDAKLAEALRQEDKARAELELGRQQVRQQLLAVWHGLSTGQAQLEALQEAQRASLARLDATQLGRQVGDRTTLDLLQAQNDATAAELALLQARAELLLQQLRLQALAGQLDEARLAPVSAQLNAVSVAPDLL